VSIEDRRHNSQQASSHKSTRAQLQASNRSKHHNNKQVPENFFLH
jgi:hypothetical protein